MFCPHCAAEVLSIAANFCYSCGKELNEKADEPKSEMSDDSSAVSANDLITEMLNRGYRYDVIVHLLENNGYKMYLRTLKRRLIDLGLKRKGKTEMDESEIELLIRREIEGAGRLAGYRNIWHALRLRHHVHVPRSLVARLMKKIDPDGVQDRSARRLTRRNYLSPGPNFCWHVDDKQSTSNS